MHVATMTLVLLSLPRLLRNALRVLILHQAFLNYQVKKQTSLTLSIILNNCFRY